MSMNLSTQGVKIWQLLPPCFLFRPIAPPHRADTATSLPDIVKGTFRRIPKLTRAQAVIPPPRHLCINIFRTTSLFIIVLSPPQSSGSLQISAAMLRSIPGLPPRPGWSQLTKGAFRNNRTSRFITSPGPTCSQQGCPQNERRQHPVLPHFPQFPGPRAYPCAHNRQHLPSSQEHPKPPSYSGRTQICRMSSHTHHPSSHH